MNYSSDSGDDDEFESPRHLHTSNNNANEYSSSEEDYNSGDDDDEEPSSYNLNQSFDSRASHNRSFQSSSSHFGQGGHDDDDDEDEDEDEDASDQEDVEETNNMSTYSSSHNSGVDTTMQDDSMIDDEEDQYHTSVAATASGKVLIRQGTDSDSDDDDDGDEGDNEADAKMSVNGSNEDDGVDADNNSALNRKSNPKQTGKTLHRATNDDDSSSDDELLVTHKSKTPPKKLKSNKSTPKKRKKSTTVTATSALAIDDDDDDAIEAVAVAHYNSDSDTVEAVVIPQAPPKKIRKKPGPKPKKKPNDEKKSSSKSKGSSSDKRSTNSKKRRIDTSNDSDSDVPCYAASVIPHDKLRQAELARERLANTVQRTPFTISDSYAVRNFGRIKIEERTNVLETLYSNATTLYPVGYSCDRYEFSPVHGRILKMRCDILDGKCEEDISTSSGVKNDVTRTNSHEKTSEGQELRKQKSNQKRGPIFRIMWGQGIDEIDDSQSFPFDLYSTSAPIGNEVDAVAIPIGIDTVKIKPEQGMRVKVNFDGNNWYFGTILQVSEKKEQEDPKKTTSTRGAAAKKEKKQRFNVEILYDDGIKEKATYPDPDVVLVPPGVDDIDEGNALNVTEVKGKPVTTVTGYSPIEAWAKALSKLGLVDEIIFEKANQSIIDAHLEGLAELKGKSDPSKKLRPEGKPKQKDGKSNAEESIDIDASVQSADSSMISSTKQSAIVMSERELKLKERVEKLLKEYEERLSESRATASELAEARIQVLGPFLSNPFLNSDISLNQQKQWLSTIIKKEKSKIGSTGNKRKIVTATDLLERTATFFNIEIERFIEGLPGSEFCPAYVFHDLRGSGASALTWIHEEQVRQEKEQEKRKQKKRRRIEEEKLQAEINREKELRKQAFEDREEKKKQKMDEIDQVKKEREQTRLTRLTNQIDEKLFKESCLQRERITFLATKLVGKEILRRRKAAETIAAFTAGNSKEMLERPEATSSNLSSLSSCYSSDVVRLWNFMTSYCGAFEGDIPCVPGIDELQDAVNYLDDVNGNISSRKKAIDLFTNIAIVLCKPMNKGLIKTLQSPLATALQDNNKGENGDDEAATTLSPNNDPDSFPIDTFTWREFARLIFLTDALTDLGYTKIEQTHILRGHRTGGHPNSKEAKRVKRGEDYALVLRRQVLSEITSDTSSNVIAVKVSVPSPCEPSAQPSDWIFFLHNIKSLPSNAATGMKSNLRKACALLKGTPSESIGCKKISKAAIITELQRNVTSLEEIGTSITSSSDTIAVCKKVRNNVLKLLDNCTGEIHSLNKASKINVQDSEVKIKQGHDVALTKHANSSKSMRLMAGLYKNLDVTEAVYKQNKSLKAKYISAAIKVIDDRDRKKKRSQGANEDDDDDDDDDDDEEENDGELQSQSLRKDSDVNNIDDGMRIGKRTEYDDFCADEPRAPDLIRRCLAVLRSLCLTSAAENFIYPVDPRSNMKYYDAIMIPMSLYDVGKQLKREAMCLKEEVPNETVIEDIVAQFGKNVRLIRHNCISYSTVGAAIISTAEEMLRIFERLFFDWVLSPDLLMPSLDMLDDERCVEFDASDEDSLVLLCDGCEGKFNMSRLDPPLSSVPKGDWYCPRCRNGYCWATVDSRIGRKVTKAAGNHDETSSTGLGENKNGIIKSCVSYIPEGATQKATLKYVVSYGDGYEEYWSLDDVDKALVKMGDPAPKIRCLEAVAESPGYGSGIMNRLTLEAVPVPLNPVIADGAAQQAIKSTVFQDMVVSSAVLLVNDVDAISSSEWLKILVLLSMKCATTEKLQEFSSKLENDANTDAINSIATESKIKSINDVISKVTDDEYDEHDQNEQQHKEKRPDLDSSIKNSLSDNAHSKNNINDGNLDANEIMDADAVISTNVDVSNVQESIDDEHNLVRNDSHTVADDQEVSNAIRVEMPSEEEMLAKQKRKEVIDAMRERQKARENSFLASCIKAQLKTGLASFEEDNVTQVINSYLSNKAMEGVDLSSSICSAVKCDLCGLTDMTLAAPLVRTPNHQEWLERMSFHCSNHESFLVADLDPRNIASYAENCEKAGSFSADNISSGSFNKSDDRRSKKTMLNTVTVRVDGEIISIKNRYPTPNDDEAGIVNFLPVNEQGFQSELKARYEDKLPFVTGSLVAHECCALAAHKSRIERVVQEEKEKAVFVIERDFGNTCGRTLALGKDGAGRWYWKFSSEPNSLFISVEDEERGRVFHRFFTPELIASAIKGLGKKSVLASDIKQAFPLASEALSNKTWSSLIQRKRFEHIFTRLSEDAEHLKDGEKSKEDKNHVSEPYEEGDEVLVESATRKMLWSAVIISSVKNLEGNVTGYRVHYKDWSSRFDEWVHPNRIVEPSDNNALFQKELSDNMYKVKREVPISLDKLQARGFLDAPNRAINCLPVMDYSKIIITSRDSSSDDKNLGLLRCATLIIEAALPMGSVDTEINGSWKAEHSAYWRSMVIEAKTPSSLMGCIVLLESVLSKDWIRPNAEHLLSCLPRPWKAIEEATVSSIALRLWVLDRGIKYGLIRDEDDEWKTFEEGEEDEEEEAFGEEEEEEEEEEDDDDDDDED